MIWNRHDKISNQICSFPKRTIYYRIGTHLVSRSLCLREWQLPTTTSRYRFRWRKGRFVLWILFRAIFGSAMWQMPWKDQGNRIELYLFIRLCCFQLWQNLYLISFRTYRVIVWMQSANISIRNVSFALIVANYLETVHSSWKMVMLIVKLIGTNYLLRNVLLVVSQWKRAIAGLKRCHTTITAVASIAPLVLIHIIDNYNQLICLHIN